MIDWKKYLLVFVITISLFLTAGYISSFFSNQKIDELRTIQDNLAINILSSETQFSLLQELSCKDVSQSLLLGEIDELGKKLEWSQSNLGNTEEVSYLKKYYSLLEIKDYLLMKKISSSCGVKSAFILYFYTTKDVCSDCSKESLVLGSLRDTYPDLRVYSFDYSTDLSAVEAMLKIYKIKDTELPALVLKDEVLTGFHNLEDLSSRVKEVFNLEERSTEATGSPKDVNSN